MKLQRLSIWDRDDMCLSSDVEALEAENEALHTECDRLTAMLGPQKPKSAEEVTESGFYWHRYGTEEWCVVDVYYGYHGNLFIYVNDEQDYALEGQFIGPIRMPEVQE